MVAGDAQAAGNSPEIDPLVGTVIGGRFQVSTRIARGGMSSVYFATQLPLNRPVALKVLRGALSGDAESAEGFRRRFLQEASILSQLSHPNIVTLIEYGEIQELPDLPYFMAMEYLRGETLAQRFRTRGRLSIEDSIRLARQIGRGLREAHRRGFVHRDLKPSNIMLVPEDDRNDIVKLVDFGIGKILRGPLERDVEDQTRVGLLLGSPRHMAPEQIRCEPVEVRTDLYGLGVILFQALTGHLPFDGRTEVDVLMAHCSLPPPTLHEMCPGQFFPESLSGLVAALLAKQPDGRPTIEEFLERLGRVEEEVFGRVGLAGPTLQSIIPNFTLPASCDSELERHTAVTQAAWRPVSLFSTGAAPSIAPHALAAEQRKKRGRWAVAVGIFALASVAGFTVRNFKAVTATRDARALRPPEPKVMALSPEPRVQTPEPRTFSLTIDSVPASASVSENGVHLGVTPLTLALTRDSVRTTPRHFLLERDGFAPYSVEQGDSETSVSAVAVLVANRKSSRSRLLRTKAGPSALQTGGEGPVGKRNDGVVLDIRPRR
jgi:serine/threonine-protein kinase